MLTHTVEITVGALRAYFTPFLVFFGLFGNALTLIIFVLEGRTHQWTRFSVYCIALALSDSGILILNGFLDDFLGRGLQYATQNSTIIKLDTSSSFMCKFMEYTPHVFYWSSSYLLLSFTCDRVLTIFKPFRFRSHMFVYKTVILSVGIVVVGCLVMSPMLAVYKLTDSSDQCRVDDSQGSILPCLMLHFKSSLVFFVPSVLVLILSLIIIVKMSFIRKNHINLLPNNQDSKMEMSRFYAHLGVSVIFCMATLPIAIIIFMRVSCSADHSSDSQDQSDYLEHLSRLLDSLKDINYAVNFWVYLICVKSFRKRLGLAVAQIVVKLRCEKLCRTSVTSWAQRSVTMLNKKRRPTLHTNIKKQKDQDSEPLNTSSGL